MNETTLWQAIEAAGPVDASTTFDPLVVDDVLAAERSVGQYERRKSFVANYAWAVPTSAGVDAIAEFVRDCKLLEIFAGTGLWAKLLASRGVRVVATDAAPVTAAAHFPVEVRDAVDATQHYADCDALMMSWPPFKDDSAARALRAFRGDRLVYVGDPRFTGDEELHRLLQEAWTPGEEVPLPSWPGTNDRVSFWRRR